MSMVNLDKIDLQIEKIQWFLKHFIESKGTIKSM